MAHTPGPWHLGERHLLDDDGEQYGYTLTAVGGTVAEQILGATFHVATVGANPGDKECEDNARLIAAAPELLTALRSVAEDLNSLDMDKNGWRDMDATAVDQLIAGALRRADAAIAKATGKESE